MVCMFHVSLINGKADHIRLSAADFDGDGKVF